MPVICGILDRAQGGFVRGWALKGMRRLSRRFWGCDCLSHVILRAGRHDVTAAASKIGTATN
jgi:hypothetical protein